MYIQPCVPVNIAYVGYSKPMQFLMYNLLISERCTERFGHSERH